MKHRSLLLVALLVGLAVPALFAQATGEVHGACKDAQGDSMVGATVTWVSPESGRQYVIKTNKFGRYFSLGIVPGQYTVTLSQDGKDIFHFNNVKVGPDTNTLDFDLQKEQGQAAQSQGISPEELRRQQAVAKEADTVKALNAKLTAAKAAREAGDLRKSIEILQSAIALDGTRDIIWGQLGGDQAALAATQPGQATALYGQAADSYLKAVALLEAAHPKDPRLGAYSNNLGGVWGKLGRFDAALMAFDEGAKVDPANAKRYYFNMGAILNNAEVKGAPMAELNEMAFHLILNVYINGASSDFEALKGEKFMALRENKGDPADVDVWKSSLRLPGAKDDCLITEGAGIEHTWIGCSLGTAPDKNQLRAEYQRLASVVKGIVPTDWSSWTVVPEPAGGPEGNYKGASATVVVSIDRLETRPAYALGVSVLKH